MQIKAWKICLILHTDFIFSVTLFAFVMQHQACEVAAVCVEVLQLSEIRWDKKQKLFVAQNY